MFWTIVLLCQFVSTSLFDGRDVSVSGVLGSGVLCFVEFEMGPRALST